MYMLAVTLLHPFFINFEFASIHITPIHRYPCTREHWYLQVPQRVSRNLSRVSDEDHRRSRKSQSKAQNTLCKLLCLFCIIILTIFNGINMKYNKMYVTLKRNQDKLIYLLSSAITKKCCSSRKRYKIVGFLLNLLFRLCCILITEYC